MPRFFAELWLTGRIEIQRRKNWLVKSIAKDLSIFLIFNDVAGLAFTSRLYCIVSDDHRLYVVSQ